MDKENRDDRQRPPPQKPKKRFLEVTEAFEGDPDQHQLSLKVGTFVSLVIIFIVDVRGF